MPSLARRKKRRRRKRKAEKERRKKEEKGRYLNDIFILDLRPIISKLHVASLSSGQDQSTK